MGDCYTVSFIWFSQDLHCSSHDSNANFGHVFTSFYSFWWITRKTPYQLWKPWACSPVVAQLCSIYEHSEQTFTSFVEKYFPGKSTICQYTCLQICHHFQLIGHFCFSIRRSSFPLFLVEKSTLCFCCEGLGARLFFRAYFWLLCGNWSCHISE